MAASTQDIHVQVIVPLSGPGKGQIGVQVGMLRVNVSDRKALASQVGAWHKAMALTDKAFVRTCRCRGWVRQISAE